MMMEPTINLFMLIRLDENLSLAICRVDGTKNITHYTMGTREDDGDIPKLIWLRGRWEENPSPNLDQGSKGRKTLS